MKKFYMPLIRLKDVDQFVEGAIGQVLEKLPGIKSDEIIFAFAMLETKKKCFGICGCVPASMLVQVCGNFGGSGERGRIMANIARQATSPEYLAKCRAENRQPYMYFMDTKERISRGGFDSVADLAVK